MPRISDMRPPMTAGPMLRHSRSFTSESAERLCPDSENAAKQEDESSLLKPLHSQPC